MHRNFRKRAAKTALNKRRLLRYGKDCESAGRPATGQNSAWNAIGNHAGGANAAALPAGAKFCNGIGTLRELTGGETRAKPAGSAPNARDPRRRQKKPPA